VIRDPSGIRSDVIRTLANNQIVGGLLHDGTSKILRSIDFLNYCREDRAIKENPQAFDAVDRSVRTLRDLYSFFRDGFRLFREDRRNEPLSEQDLKSLHERFDHHFRMNCSLKLSGLHESIFRIAFIDYRFFLQTVMELAFMTVGRHVDPVILIEYKEVGEFLTGRLILRGAAEAELDSHHLNFVELLGIHSDLDFESVVSNDDRMFRWKIRLAGIKTES
jgi:hypothetical protein